MKIATPMAFLAATLLVGSLAACSSDSKEADASPSAPVVGTSSTPMESSAAPSASRSEDATAEDTPAPAAPADLGELTAPGAELSTDQPLNVSLRSTLYDKEADAVFMTRKPMRLTTGTLQRSTPSTESAREARRISQGCSATTTSPSSLSTTSPTWTTQ